MNLHDLEQKELIILDVDGTLVADYNSTTLIRDVMIVLIYLYGVNPNLRLALATNQGGPACREVFNNSKYPTVDDVEQRLQVIVDQMLDLIGIDRIPIYVAWAYRLNNDQVVVPKEKLFSEEAKISWRKPNGQMLTTALIEAYIPPEGAVMVGDRNDDRLAAEVAGVDFLDVNDLIALKLTIAGYQNE